MPHLVDAPLNPYESPVIPEEAKSAGEPLGVIARFTMDEAIQWASAGHCTAPMPAWIYWSTPIWLFLFGAAILLGMVAMGPFGGGAVLFLSFLGAALIHSMRSRKVALQMLAQLQSHPVLGATGDWKITIDRQQILVETPRGRRDFPLSETPLNCLEGTSLVFWFEGRFPITIPEYGATARAAWLLRQWLWHIGDQRCSS